MEIKSWQLSDGQIQVAVDKLRKINARAEKKGLQGRYSWRKGEVSQRPKFDTSQATCTINGIPSFLLNGQPVPCPMIGMEKVTEFTVEGSAPVFGGWAFIARVTADEGALVLRTIPGFDGQIDRDSIRLGECDHCKKTRKRSDTFLVANESTGELLQVGSACVKDFLGHGFSASSYDMDGEALEELERSFSDFHSDWLTETILARAIAAIRLYGFASKANERDGGPTSTASTVHAALNGGDVESRRIEAETRPTEDDIARASIVLDWVKEQTDSSDYMQNLKSVCSVETVSERNWGILVSAPQAYNRAQEREAEKISRKASEWIGEVGTKIEIVGTLRAIRNIPSDFGCRYLYTFINSDGNLVKWMASTAQQHPHDEKMREEYGWCSPPWVEGDQIHLRGTIKTHEEWNGVKSTVLTRCKQLELVG